MRIVRYSTSSGQRWGLLSSSGAEVAPIIGPFAQWAPVVMAGEAPSTESATVEFSSLELLPPVEPSSQIVGIGYNYETHRPAPGAQSPVYTKPYSSFVGARAELAYPDLNYTQPQAVFSYRPELALVIGKTYPRDALASGPDLLGYTIANNGWSRHLKPSFVGHDLFGAVSSYHSSSLGPWIVTRDEFGDTDPILTIKALINGVEVASVSTSAMWRGIDDTLGEVSQRTRLAAGDVVLTGSGMPEDSAHGVYHPGERVDVVIEGIGTLTNTVPAQDNYRFAPPIRWGGALSLPQAY